VAGPSPVPLPVVTVIHAALLVEDHPHPLVAFTPTEVEPPAAVTDPDALSSEKVHVAAACVTEKVCPATVSVAVRATVVVWRTGRSSGCYFRTV